MSIQAHRSHAIESGRNSRSEKVKFRPELPDAVTARRKRRRRRAVLTAACGSAGGGWDSIGLEWPAKQSAASRTARAGRGETSSFAFFSSLSSLFSLSSYLPSCSLFFSYQLTANNVIGLVVEYSPATRGRTTNTPGSLCLARGYELYHRTVAVYPDHPRPP